MTNHNSQNFSKKIKLALYTCFPLEEACLRKVLETEKDVQIIGGTNHLPELIQILNQFEPQVIVYFASEKNTHFENIKELRTASPDTRLLVIIDDDDQNTQLWALQNGASGIVQKDQNPKTLIWAIRQIARGETWINQKLMSRFLNNNHKGASGYQNEGQLKGEALTDREIEVLKVLCEGLSNKEIGKKLFISEPTVRHHLSSIYSKLYIKDRLNLIIYAYQNNIAGQNQQMSTNNYRRQRFFDA
jgi:two-component system response regulator DegU